MSGQVYDDVEQNLKDLYSEVPSPPSGLRRARGRLLSEAAELRSRQVNPPLSASQTGDIRRRRKMNLIFAYKALAVVLAVAVAVAGMGGGVVLAADALPGEFLYQVKILSEDVRLVLTRDPSARAELQMAFLDLRVQEMARLAQHGEEIRQAEVDRMTRQMEQVMVEIAKSQPNEAPALLGRLIERTWLHQQVLEDALSQTQTRLWEAIQLMERTRLNAQNDPRFLEYQYQYQYEGSPGPHGANSPTPAAVRQQTQEQNQQSYQATQGPRGEATPSQQQQQVQQEEQHRYEGTAGPHGQTTPTPTMEPVNTAEPDVTSPPETDPEQAQEENQYGQEGTPGPHGQQSPPSDEEPQPTHTQQQGGSSDNPR